MGSVDETREAVLSVLKDAPDECPPGPDEFLTRLRAEFPKLGFVADPSAGAWFAVGGGGFFVRGRTGIELRERLIAVGWRPR
ncbi:hypothetical protein GCM10022254_23610 [Actinomadura meridiana]|uniref:Uncharacterized protein n=1 Tax=Actinomadura meridiana TaxID=559626 RepID=A0ABP8BY61_9ACTN